MSRQVGALWNTHGDSVVPYDYVVGYSILCEFVDDAGSVIMSTPDFYLPLGCLFFQGGKFGAANHDNFGGRPHLINGGLLNQGWQ